MMKLAFGVALALAAVPAVAQSFPGPLIAKFYMQEFTIPKGFELSYKGVENGAQVFIMDRDLDTYPQTVNAAPINQMRRLMCGDDNLKVMVDGGIVIRVDSRDKRNGKVTTTKGPTLSRC